MNRIVLLNPPRLVFGENSLAQFIDDYAKLGLQRLYLLSIESVVAQIQNELEALREQSIEIKINTSITAEPTFSEFENLLIEARSFNADSVVGIGGGSVLDVAKLVAAQIKNAQSTADVTGIANLKQRATYLVCIPTTSGTGSEVSPNAIFVDDQGAKVGVISPYLVPDAAYLDPALTCSVPAAITASTGMDALTHNLEAYINNFSHPLIDLMALEGIRLISDNLLRACENGNDMEARAKLALGSMYGGMCLGPVNTGAVHALSYPLGVTYHVPHGLSVSLLLPYVMEFNLPSAPARMAQVSLALGAEAAASDVETSKKGIQLIKKLITDCGLPSSMEELNIPCHAIESMATDALKVQRLLKNNVRMVTQKDAENIYRAAFKNI